MSHVRIEDRLISSYKTGSIIRINYYCGIQAKNYYAYNYKNTPWGPSGGGGGSLLGSS